MTKKEKGKRKKGDKERKRTEKGRGKGKEGGGERKVTK